MRRGGVRFLYWPVKWVFLWECSSKWLLLHVQSVFPWSCSLLSRDPLETIPWGNLRSRNRPGLPGAPEGLDNHCVPDEQGQNIGNGLISHLVRIGVTKGWFPDKCSTLQKWIAHDKCKKKYMYVFVYSPIEIHTWCAYAHMNIQIIYVVIYIEYLC